MGLSKMTAGLGALAIATFASCGSGFAISGTDINFVFAMVPTGGVEACIPKAAGRVTITHSLLLVENMHVEVTGLPANTDFDLFVIQQPTTPFGLAWYMGDILTDGNGEGVNDFVGRFSAGTFSVAPGATSAPVTQTGDANTNPPFKPIQQFHLGLWFDSPADANKAGCGDTVTPFNSTHNGGVQILNTSNFGAVGPLFRVTQ